MLKESIMIKKYLVTGLSLLALARAEGAYAFGDHRPPDGPFYIREYEYLTPAIYDAKRNFSSIGEAKDYLNVQISKGALKKIGADLFVFSEGWFGIKYLASGNEKNSLSKIVPWLASHLLWSVDFANKLINEDQWILFNLVGRGVCWAVNYVIPETACLEKDPLFDYEAQLVFEWDNLSTVLKQKIANQIFSLRRGQNEKIDDLGKMFSVFNIPKSTKELVYDKSVLEKSLAGLDQGLINQLKDIAFTHTLKSKNPNGGRKVSFYLFGKPGTGKTEASKALTLAMGGESCTISLSGKTVEDLQGSKHKIGLLAQCLIDTNVTNPVVILDDADWELNAPGSSMLGFGLLLSDPEIRKIKDEFLETDIDIGNMMFVYSGNSLVQKNGNPVEAWEQRVRTISFGGFNDSYRLDFIMNNTIPSLIKAYATSGEVTQEMMRPLIESYFRELSANSTNETDQDKGMRRPIDKANEIFFAQLRQQHEQNEPERREAGDQKMQAATGKKKSEL